MPVHGQLDVQRRPKPPFQSQLDRQFCPKSPIQGQLDLQRRPKSPVQGQLDVHRCRKRTAIPGPAGLPVLCPNTVPERACQRTSQVAQGLENLTRVPKTGPRASETAKVPRGTARCKVRDPRFKVQGWRCKIQEPWSKIQVPRSKILQMQLNDDATK